MNALNPKQMQAVHYMEGPLLVLAGAGSGKTRIVTYRIAHLIHLGVPSSEILAVTFTNKAADEMRSRIQHLCQKQVLSVTFHSLCARILRESIEPLGFKRNFMIFDDEDSEKTLKECFDALGLKEEKSTLKEIKQGISNAKNHLIFPEKVSRDEPLLYEIYPLYQRKLKEYNALDFDDLLIKSVELFEEFPDMLDIYQRRWGFILIDEYQDTNAAQYSLIKLLSKKHNQVFAVGDPDQSIYSWRGANIANILNFEKDFPGSKIITLEQNYRSTESILQAANALIAHNQARYEKNLWSDLGEGEKIGLAICDTDHEEVDFVLRKLRKHLQAGVSAEECVIFYRTNFQSRVFEDGLLRDNIPYEIIGGLSFYQRREIKDILAYLRMIIGDTDGLSFARSINTPKRGLGESSLKKIKDCAEAYQLGVWEACLKIVKGELESPLSSKQLQALKGYMDNLVFFRELNESKTPPDEILETVIEKTNYLAHLQEDPLTYQERKENLLELVSKASEWKQQVAFPTLVAFLEEISLKTHVESSDDQLEHIKLMTLHNSKGLEFEVVFLVGMEEDLFPHLNSKDSKEGLEEERRLCYVGMTRAKKHLYLSGCRTRFLWGAQRYMKPSRFLMEIPKEYLKTLEGGSLYTESEERYVFPISAKVYHRDFGHGIVKKSYNTSLGLTYDVYFPSLSATRSLVAKFAKLTLSDFM